MVERVLLGGKAHVDDQDPLDGQGARRPGRRRRPVTYDHEGFTEQFAHQESNDCMIDND